MAQVGDTTLPTGIPIAAVVAVQPQLQRKNHEAAATALMSSSSSSCWSLRQTQAIRAALLKEPQAFDVEETSDTFCESSSDEEYDDHDDDCSFEDEIDAVQDEAETRIARVLAQAAFQKRDQPAAASSSSAAVLHRLLQSSWHEAKREQQQQLQQHTSPQRPVKRARSSLQAQSVTNSTVNHHHHPLPITTLVREASVSMRLSISAPLLVTEPMHKKGFPENVKAVVCMKPDDCLQQLLRNAHAGGAVSQSLSKNPSSIRYHPAAELTNFFVPLTSAALEAYTADLTRAVHQQDVAALRRWHAERQESTPGLATSPGAACGETQSLWHAGNKFGETIVHAACRRGSIPVLSFLLSHGAPLQVCCDAYRTPLHDACWTSTDHPGPLLDLILDACPDLLYILDARGFTPLQYVPRAQWSVWNDYLTRRGAPRLRPTSLDIGV
jgi:Ankyrin repeat